VTGRKGGSRDDLLPLCARSKTFTYVEIRAIMYLIGGPQDESERSEAASPEK